MFEPRGRNLRGIVLPPEPKLCATTDRSTLVPHHATTRRGICLFLLGLDARVSNYFRILGELAAHERIELLGRAAATVRAELTEPLLDIGQLDDAGDFAVEFRDDCRRRARGGVH